MRESLLSFKNNGYKLLLFFIYDGIYFPWFLTLEKMHSQNAPFTAISIPLDFFIPFLDVFGAIGLSLVLYILIYRLPFFFKKESRA